MDELRLLNAIEEMLDRKLEEKLEVILEEKLEEKLDAKLDAKFDAKLDAKFDAKLDAKFDEKLSPVLVRLDRLEMGQAQLFQEQRALRRDLNRKFDHLTLAMDDGFQNTWKHIAQLKDETACDNRTA